LKRNYVWTWFSLSFFANAGSRSLKTGENAEEGRGRRESYLDLSLKGEREGVYKDGKNSSRSEPSAGRI